MEITPILKQGSKEIPLFGDVECKKGFHMDSFPFCLWGEWELTLKGISPPSGGTVPPFPLKLTGEQPVIEHLDFPKKLGEDHYEWMIHFEDHAPPLLECWVLASWDIVEKKIPIAEKPEATEKPEDKSNTWKGSSGAEFRVDEQNLYLLKNSPDDLLKKLTPHFSYPIKE